MVQENQYSKLLEVHVQVVLVHFGGSSWVALTPIDCLCWWMIEFLAVKH